MKPPCYICGKPFSGGETLEVTNPYNNHIVGEVPVCGKNQAESAIEGALKVGERLSRYQRSSILEKAAGLLNSRREEFANLITQEAGLCLRETRYEVGRALDVLRFAALEALKDDGEIYSCDISPQGKNRKIFTLREPLSLVVAITPFNHPLNQVAHKLAPAIAAGAPVILKPSEKTPLTALKFAEVLYEAGLPGWMLSVLLGPSEAVAIPLIQDARVDLVTFTGSVAVGKKIAATAGYKKVVLELGGNDPLIILKDADMDLAVTLAAEGSYRNSGQRCTAVKRILVDRSIHDEFLARFVERSKEYICGDPMDEETRVGTVIDENAAMQLESVVHEAKSAGANILLGGNRKGALMAPTVLSNVPRDAQIVANESFGPLAPVMAVDDLKDAIQLANSTAYGLSSGVVTQNMNWAIQAVKQLKAGTVNINEVPGFRIESSPFGGIKDSGLGVKEGVREAMKCMTNVKTFSLPW